MVAILLAACSRGYGVPTRARPAAPVSQIERTPTANPTPDRATSTPTAIGPTPSPTPSVTPVVAFRPPTPQADKVINLTSPAAGEAVTVGSTLKVGGLVRVEAGQHVSVTLTSASDVLLAQAVTEIEWFGAFQTELTVPLNIAGTASLRATVMDTDARRVASDAQALNLTVETNTDERYLALFHPDEGALAVSGFQLFFDGRTLFPEDNLLQIAIRDASCQQVLASQSYRLRGSGYWQGFVVVPRDLLGPACAVAHFGDPLEPDYWREVQVPIEVIPRDDQRATAVRVGNPPAGAEVERGESILIYGTAWNAPRNIVNVSVLLENGRVLNEGVAVADGFGYWEELLFIPASAVGPAEIVAVIGDEADDLFARHRTLIEVVP